MKFCLGPEWNKATAPLNRALIHMKRLFGITWLTILLTSVKSAGYIYWAQREIEELRLVHAYVRALLPFFVQRDVVGEDRYGKDI